MYARKIYNMKNSFKFDDSNNKHSTRYAKYDSKPSDHRLLNLDSKEDLISNQLSSIDESQKSLRESESIDRLKNALFQSEAQEESLPLSDRDRPNTSYYESSKQLANENYLSNEKNMSMNNMSEINLNDFHSDNLKELVNFVHSKKEKSLSKNLPNNVDEEQQHRTRYTDIQNRLKSSDHQNSYDSNSNIRHGGHNRMRILHEYDSLDHDRDAPSLLSDEQEQFDRNFRKISRNNNESTRFQAVGTTNNYDVIYEDHNFIAPHHPEMNHVFKGANILNDFSHQKNDTFSKNKPLNIDNKYPHHQGLSKDPNHKNLTTKPITNNESESALFINNVKRITAPINDYTFHIKHRNTNANLPELNTTSPNHARFSIQDNLNFLNNINRFSLNSYDKNLYAQELAEDVKKARVSLNMYNEQFQNALKDVHIQDVSHNFQKKTEADWTVPSNTPKINIQDIGNSQRKVLDALASDPTQKQSFMLGFIPVDANELDQSKVSPADSVLFNNQQEFSLSRIQYNQSAFPKANHSDFQSKIDNDHLKQMSFQKEPNKYNSNHVDEVNIKQQMNNVPIKHDIYLEPLNRESDRYRPSLTNNMHEPSKRLSEKIDFVKHMEDYLKVKPNLSIHPSDILLSKVPQFNFETPVNNQWDAHNRQSQNANYNAIKSPETPKKVENSKDQYSEKVIPNEKLNGTGLKERSQRKKVERLRNLLNNTNNIIDNEPSNQHIIFEALPLNKVNNENDYERTHKDLLDVNQHPNILLYNNTQESERTHSLNKSLPKTQNNEAQLETNVNRHIGYLKPDSRSPSTSKLSENKSRTHSKRDVSSQQQFRDVKVTNLLFNSLRLVDYEYLLASIKMFFEKHLPETSYCYILIDTNTYGFSIYRIPAEKPIEFFSIDDKVQRYNVSKRNFDSANGFVNRTNFGK